MIKICIGNTQKITNKEFETEIQNCSAYSRQRISAKAQRTDMNASLCAILCVRDALAALGLDKNLITNMAYSETGKPYIANNSKIRISISHAGNAAIAAVCDDGEDIGVDIEPIRQNMDFSFIANRFFTEGELKVYNGEVENFYRVWTRKEAGAKLSGDVGALLKIDSENCPYFFQTKSFFAFGEKYMLTICTKTKEALPDESASMLL